jgi:hypothetical protein
MRCLTKKEFLGVLGALAAKFVLGVEVSALQNRR